MGTSQSWGSRGVGSGLAPRSLDWPADGSRVRRWQPQQGGHTQGWAHGARGAPGDVQQSLGRRDHGKVISLSLVTDPPPRR